MTQPADKVADIETSQGPITIKFFPDKAPNHVRFRGRIKEEDRTRSHYNPLEGG